MSDTPRTPESKPFGSGTTETPSASGVARETREFASNKAEQAKQQAGKMADKASSAMSSGMDTAQARLQDFQDWSSHQQDSARERIREHPLTYCAMSLCTGMLLGMLISRR